MNIEEIEKLAKGINSLCCEAKRSAKDKLYNCFVENYKESGTGCFPLSNYIIECDGDLYFLKKWAEAKTPYWENHEVATIEYGIRTASVGNVVARRIKLDGSLSKKVTMLTMVVDGWEDEEAGYLDYHFELDEEVVSK